MRKRFSGEDLKELSREELYDLAQKFELAVRKNSTREKLIEALLPFVQKSEKKATMTVKPVKTAKATAETPAKLIAKPENNARPVKAKSAAEPPRSLQKAKTENAEKTTNSAKKSVVAAKKAAVPATEKPVKTRNAEKKPAEPVSDKKGRGRPPKKAVEIPQTKAKTASVAEKPVVQSKETVKDTAKVPAKKSAKAADNKELTRAAAKTGKATKKDQMVAKNSVSTPKTEPAKNAAKSEQKSATPVKPAGTVSAAKTVAKSVPVEKEPVSPAKKPAGKVKEQIRPAILQPVPDAEKLAKKVAGRSPESLPNAERPVELPPKKGRGRPAKVVEEVVEPAITGDVSGTKKRGRPSNKAAATQVSSSAVATTDEQTSASDSAVKGLAHNFAKKADDAPLAKSKKGAEVLKDGVAIPVELTAHQKSSSKAEQVEKELSQRYSSLKTTMEIPIFQPISELESASTISEDELTGELPLEYGETRIVMQVRDPHWAYAYWEIPRIELKRLELEVGIFEFAHSHFVLRLHNVSQGFSQEIKLSEHARNWYIYLESPQTVYQVELGMHSPTEGYTFIALSNLVQTPPDSVAERWAAPIAAEPVAVIEPEERLGGHEFVVRPESPGIARITEPEQVYFSSVSGDSIPHPGSSELLAGQKLVPPGMPSSADVAFVPGGVSSFEMPSSFGMPSSFAMPTSPMPSSADWTSAGVSSYSKNPEDAEDDDIFLTAAVEVIVYGRVKVGCELTFQGNPLRVRPDGSFSLRLALPFDSSHSIDLVATDPVTKNTRTIKAAVSLKKH